MTSNASYRFLRPSTIRSCTGTLIPSYARFFSAAQAALNKTASASNDYGRRIEHVASVCDHSLGRFYPRMSSPGLQSMAQHPQLRSLEPYEHLGNGEVAQPRYRLQGRIKSIRSAGSKLVFIDLIPVSSIERSGDGYGPFQAVLDFGILPEGESSDKMWRDFKRVARAGDWIGFTGKPYRTARGQLSLLALHVPMILAPCYNQVPTETKDQEKLARHRHVDMIVNSRTRDVLRVRHEVIRTIRRFWEDKGFIEVNTPLLAADAGGAAARPFQTQANEFSSIPLSLRIAPELYLKRLVVGNMPRVFEIGQAFRNEDYSDVDLVLAVDRTHNPEFTICEAYSAFISLKEMMNDIQLLLWNISTAVSKMIRERQLESSSIPMPTLAGLINRQPIKELPFLPTLEDEISKRLQALSTSDSASEAPSPVTYQFPDLAGRSTRKDLLSLFAQLRLPTPDAPTIPRLLDTLQSEFLEPLCIEPTFIIYPPAALSPLARTFQDKTSGQTLSARVELFIHGREYVNAYEEENSPILQRRKFMRQRHYEAQGLSAAHLATKLSDLPSLADEPQTMLEKHVPTQKAGRDGGIHSQAEAPLESVVDESYIEALGWGLPPVTGFGCGVDRLVMLFTGSDRIADVLSFGNLRNVVSIPQNRPGQ